jgi:hypothetical protein
MKVVNLMKHDAKIQNSDGEVVSYPPCGVIATASEEFESTGLNILGAPVVKRLRTGLVDGLPDPVAGTVYLVAGVVLDALEGSGRSDVFAPDSGPSAVRNPAGHVLHVTRLVAVR